jgi:hypothetical protein
MNCDIFSLHLAYITNFAYDPLGKFLDFSTIDKSGADFPIDTSLVMACRRATEYRFCELGFSVKNMPQEIHLIFCVQNQGSNYFFEPLLPRTYTYMCLFEQSL